MAVAGRGLVWLADADAPPDIQNALRAAKSRLRWQRAWRLMGATLFAPLFGAAIWIGLAKFGSLDLPRWPALALFAAWLAALVVWQALSPVSAGEAARYLDVQLGLDERVSTAVEILRARSAASGRPHQNPLHAALASDAALLLKERLHLLPGILHGKAAVTHGLLITAGVLVLGAILVVPTPYDAARAERQAVTEALAAQSEMIAELKAELVARPDIPERIRHRMMGELQTLEERLGQVGTDRAEALAAIADAQGQLREMATTPASEFDSLVGAALTVQNGAIDNSEWDAQYAKSTGELGRAAEAAQFLSEVVHSLTSVQTRGAAVALSRAAGQATPTEPLLGKSLSDGAQAIVSQDLERASESLLDVARRFQEADEQQRISQAVERLMSELDEGRREVAQAGKTAASKGQVGFRRAGATPSTQVASEEASAAGDLLPTGPGAGAEIEAENGSLPAADINPPSGLGPRIGQNAPAFDVQRPAGGDASQGTAGGQSSQGGQSGQTGQQGSQSGDAADPQGGGGAGAGSPNGRVQGPIQGPISGPNAPSGGGAGQGENPAGYGVSSPGKQSGGPQQGTDQVYIPGQGATQGSSGGTNVPTGPLGPGTGSQNGIEGRAGAGATGESVSGSPGQGALTTVRTPYKEVIGRYAEQAAQALERAYVPADAKQYVKDYFTALAK